MKVMVIEIILKMMWKIYRRLHIYVHWEFLLKIYEILYPKK